MTDAVEQTPPLEAFLRRHERRLLAAAVLLLVLLAWTNRFIQDDAFISFRYARHLAEGHGLVWNIGEPVEGYTNFLWVLMIAAGIASGADPVVWSQGLGLLFFAGTLLAAYRLVRGLLGGAVGPALGAVVLLGTNYTVSIYATGGLETPLLAFLTLLVAERTAAGLRRGSWTDGELAVLSLAMAAALMTRLDAGVFCAAAAAACLLSWRRAGATTALRRAAALSLPAVLLVGAWFAWKLSYYGDILPNTFRAKGSFDAFVRGGWYLHRFASSYFLYPVLLVAAAAARRFLGAAAPGLTTLAAMLLAEIAYVASVGGDFMEFRFLVPAVCLAVPLGAWLLSAFVTHLGARAALAALLVYGSLHHATTFRYDSFYEIESKAMLQSHLFDPKEQWVNVGKTLGAAFGHDPGVRIAVTAAGAIPYYSNLTTIDMLGLNDRFIPAGGIVLGSRPGHRRVAPLSYLRERGVHLAVSHPTLVPIGAPTFVAPFLPRAEGEPVPDIPLLEIPVDAGRKLVVWYLTPDPRVDAAIARGGWKVSRVAADSPPGDPSALK